MHVGSQIQRSSFARLIKVYTAIISVMVVLATAIFVGISIRSYETEVRQAEGTAEAQIGQVLSQNQQIVNQFATQIAGTNDNMTSLQKYFNLSVSDYSNYSIDKSLNGGDYFYWPAESRQFMIEHGQVTKLTLRMTNQKRVFVATTANTSGSLRKENKVQQRFAINAPLVNRATLSVDGVLSISFDQGELHRQLRQLSAVRPLQMVVQSEDGSEVFSFTGDKVSATQRREFRRAVDNDSVSRLQGYRVTTKQVASNYHLTMAVNESALVTLMLGRVLPLLLLGLVLMLGLSGGLWLTFRRYQHQLDTIVDTVQKVSAGELGARVSIAPKPTDLNTLASGINAMLEEINAHIYTIYQLQIAQQEANMKALQAQINPHFMSNTLEYIRMAALEAQQPELAQVVYSFAALLRNNTDLSPRTTVKRELSFIEKYVFLYQVRFPDRLAYQFSVEPEVANVELPKFSLQPLVENYFVHGVDFARQDNALSVKAWREHDGVHIRVVNNGQPLSADEVTMINRKMREPLAAEQQRSIGLQNVYSRMHDYFGDSFTMRIGSDGKRGVVCDVVFDDRGSQTKENKQDA